MLPPAPIDLADIYHRLFAHFGPQRWWPGDTPFEVMVGAVLTQNTNWQNVEKAIANLKNDGLLAFGAMESLPRAKLAERIRPCGYYNIKSERLANLLAAIREDADGDLERFFAQDTATLREKLLAVKGIGPETADSILLYAARKPIFVVDAYTHRLLARHEMIDPDEADYHAIQEMFMDALPLDERLFNEYHALIVRVGKEFCKKKRPLCGQCPLGTAEASPPAAAPRQ